MAKGKSFVGWIVLLSIYGIVSENVDIVLDDLLVQILRTTPGLVENSPSLAVSTLFGDGVGCDILTGSACISSEFEGPCCDWGNGTLKPLCPSSFHCGHVPPINCNHEKLGITVFGLALRRGCLVPPPQTSTSVTIPASSKSPSCNPDDGTPSYCGSSAFQWVEVGGIIGIGADAIITSTRRRCVCDSLCVVNRDCCFDYDTKCWSTTLTTTTRTTTPNALPTGSCAGNCKRQGLIALGASPGYCSCEAECFQQSPVVSGKANLCCDDIESECPVTVASALLSCPATNPACGEFDLLCWNGAISCARVAKFYNGGLECSEVAKIYCPADCGEPCPTTSSTTTTSTTTTSSTTSSSSSESSTTLSSTTSTSSTGTSTTYVCIDVTFADGSKWHDSFRGQDIGCAEYEALNLCEVNAGKFAYGGYTGDLACCACGGGINNGRSPPTADLTTTVTTTASNSQTSTITSTATSTVTQTQTSSETTSETSTGSTSVTTSVSSSLSTTATSTLTTTVTTQFIENQFTAASSSVLDSNMYLAIRMPDCRVQLSKLAELLEDCGLGRDLRGTIVCDGRLVRFREDDVETATSILNDILKVYANRFNIDLQEPMRSTVDGFVGASLVAANLINRALQDNADGSLVNCILPTVSQGPTTPSTPGLPTTSDFYCTQDPTLDRKGLYLSSETGTCGSHALALTELTITCGIAHSENGGILTDSMTCVPSEIGSLIKSKSNIGCSVVKPILQAMIQNYVQPQRPGQLPTNFGDFFDCTPTGFFRLNCGSDSCDSCQGILELFNEAVTAYLADGAFRDCDLTTVTTTQSSSVTTTQTKTETSSLTSTATSTVTSTQTSTFSSTLTSTVTHTETSTQTSTLETTQTTTQMTSATTTQTTTPTTESVCFDFPIFGDQVWQDDKGFGCSAFASLNLCDSSTAPGGYTPEQACCACGGGSRYDPNNLCAGKCDSTEVVNYVAESRLTRCYCDETCHDRDVCCPRRDLTCPAPNPVDENCRDITINGAEWHDSQDAEFNCQAYQDLGWCPFKLGQSSIAEGFPFAGFTAAEACCICGGGTRVQAEDDCRTPQGGASCKTCDESTGKCLTCKKRLYHLDGRCVEAEDCESLGQIPFGKKFSYRACITKMTGECVEPNCRPTIKNCIRSFLNNNKKEICSECKSTRFLVGGKCKFTKACKNGEYADGEECQCEFSDFDDCKICDHFKKRGKPELHRTLSNGVFQTCTQCFKSKFFFNDTCVDTCPEGLTIYFPKPWIKKCVKPYVCEKGTVAFGEDKGQPCVCSEDCISCDYRPGYTQHCTLCQNAKYVTTNGACISSSECIKSGGIPSGSADTGRICSSD
eukprot:m.33100 g.33100  ORF g.33100 m.33100 type:complete len:1340 (+) comp8488_c0_seq1:226-4245(+)